MISESEQRPKLGQCLTGVGIYPAIRAGATDSLNPGALSGLLLFGLFLYIIFHFGRRVDVRAFFFCVGFLIAGLGINLALCDGLFRSVYFNWFIDITLFVIIVGSVLTGGRIFLDWSVLHRTGELSRCWVKLPYVTYVPQINPGRISSSIWAKYGRRLLTGLCCLGIGVTVAFISSTWPADVYLGFIHYMISLPGKGSFGFQSLLAYTVAYMLWIWIFLAFAVWLHYHRPVKPLPASRVTIVQISLSALLIAYGLALSMYFF